MGKTRREIMSLLAIRSSYREPFVFLRQINIPPCVLVCQEPETNPMNIPNEPGNYQGGTTARPSVISIPKETALWILYGAGCQRLKSRIPFCACHWETRHA
ncbi:hypothetical protein RB213_005010 [Colletotrichum asianum]